MKTKKLRSDLNWSEFVALAVHVELRFSAPPMCLFSYAMVVTRWYLLHFRLRRGVLQDLVEKRRSGTHVPTHSTLLTLCTPTCSISVEEVPRVLEPPRLLRVFRAARAVLLVAKATGCLAKCRLAGSHALDFKHDKPRDPPLVESLVGNLTGDSGD